HFTPLRLVGAAPTIARGEGCYVWDTEGKRYLDGLAGMFVSQVGHGRRELAEAAFRQASTLHYFPIWGHAHQPAVDLAARLAALAPGDLNRVFFTTGGSEAVESAWKFAQQYFQAIGQPQRRKVIARDLAYHGTTMGALSITGLTEIKEPFEPLVPGTVHVPATILFRSGMTPEELAAARAGAIEEAILREGPETVAMVILEPVQNAGGCIPPPADYFRRVREICDRYGVLYVSDEVICGFGRLGHMFGCRRFGVQPDMITCAKGLTSGYSPLGACIISDRLAEPFLGEGPLFLHGITFGGHPVSCAVALANLDVIEGEDLLGRVRDNEALFRGTLEALWDIPIVGDIRGAGYFWAIELVKDRQTNGQYNDEEADLLLRDLLTPELVKAGLICRADDRGDPVIQLSPPLIMEPHHFEETGIALRKALEIAAAEVAKL
ncbi:MAG: aspartate aminotransferase family protein, partial [Acidimicrobiia bacterium]|nr:aspartate aminotransferase family protein [Acidimicrobiia bacterium]